MPQVRPGEWQIDYEMIRADDGEPVMPAAEGAARRTQLRRSLVVTIFGSVSLLALSACGGSSGNSLGSTALTA